MAKAWMKSLQCKSRALDDVVLFQPKQKHQHHNRRHHHVIPNSASCRKSVQSLRDVVETAKPRRKPKSPQESTLPTPRQPPTTTAAARVKTKRSMTISEPFSGSRGARPSNSSRISRSAAEPFVPTLTELPEGHPSRNVVEIIFHTSWSPSPKEFSGRIEMVFKVQNLPRTVTRFEEYREGVKSRAAAGEEDSKAGLGEDGARCVADGNEVMRFYCLGPTSGEYDACGCSWTFGGGKGAAICTFAESGGAHESAGGGRGRRAILVCRVIAGRVCKQLGFGSFGEAKGGGGGYDSVSGENSELLVFDSRAVLPCFLIIYKL